MSTLTLWTAMIGFPSFILICYCPFFVLSRRFFSLSFPAFNYWIFFFVLFNSNICFFDIFSFLSVCIQKIDLQIYIYRFAFLFIRSVVFLFSSIAVAFIIFPPVRVFPLYEINHPLKTISHPLPFWSPIIDHHIPSSSDRLLLNIKVSPYILLLHHPVRWPNIIVPWK